jgi:HK97 family phage major capsid protein
MPLDMKDAADLLNGIKSDVEALRESHEAALAEKADKGAVDVLIEEKMTRINAAIDKSQAQLDQLEASVRRKSATVTDEHGNTVNLEAKAREFAALAFHEGGAKIQRTLDVDAFDSKALKEYGDAFEVLVRSNWTLDQLSETERKALSVGVDSAGGYLVPPDMSGRMVMKEYETTEMRQFASVQVVSGTSLSGLYDNDEASAGWVSELGARTETGTPSIGAWDIPVHELYAMPAVSQKMLDDSAINIDAWLGDKIGQRFGRVESAAFVSGSGAGQPRGFLTYPNSTDLTVGIEQFSTGVNGDFAATPAGADQLIKMQYELKSKYAANARWFMKRQTAGVLRTIKNSDGAYIWQSSIAVGQPNGLLGHPVAFVHEMPAIAPGALAIAFGDMREAYQIVDRMGIRMLRDPYSSKPNVLFYATKRSGGDLVNGEAIKLLKFSA